MSGDDQLVRLGSAVGPDGQQLQGYSYGHPESWWVSEDGQWYAQDASGVMRALDVPPQGVADDLATMETGALFVGAATSDTSDLGAPPPPPPPPPPDDVPEWAADADAVVAGSGSGPIAPPEELRTRRGRGRLARLALTLLAAGAVLLALGIMADVLGWETGDGSTDTTAAAGSTTTVQAGGPVTTAATGQSGAMLTAAVSCADIAGLVPELGGLDRLDQVPTGPAAIFTSVSSDADCVFDAPDPNWEPDPQLCVDRGYICDYRPRSWVVVSVVHASPGTAGAIFEELRDAALAAHQDWCEPAGEYTWAWPCIKSVDTPVDSAGEFAIDVMRELRGYDHPEQDNVEPENQPYGWFSQFGADQLWSVDILVRGDDVYVVQAMGHMGGTRTWNDGHLYPVVPAFTGPVEDFNPVIFGLPPHNQLVLSVRNALDLLASV